MTCDEALAVLDREEDRPDPQRRPSAQAIRPGIDLARAARAKGVPTLFATGHSHPGAAEIAVGCVMKPYTDRQLCKAIECVDRHLQGEKVKPPKGLELFIASTKPSRGARALQPARRP